MYKAIIRRRGSNELATVPADSPSLRCAFIMHEDKTWSPATNLRLRIPVNQHKEVDLGNESGEAVEVLLIYNSATNEGEQSMICFAQNFGRREIEVRETLKGLAARNRTPPLVTAHGWPQ
jgi:hypothetical protein